MEIKILTEDPATVPMQTFASIHQNLSKVKINFFLGEFFGLNFLTVHT